LQLRLRRLFLFAGDALRGAPDFLFEAGPLLGELPSHLVHGGVARLALRVLHPDAEVALGFSG
jgi:hypothetical protein